MASGETPCQGSPGPVHLPSDSASEEENARSWSAEGVCFFPRTREKALPATGSYGGAFTVKSAWLDMSRLLRLHKQGMSQDVIARLVGVGHSTVSRWLQAGTFPERKPREQASQLDPYRSYGKSTTGARERSSHEHLPRTPSRFSRRRSYANVCAQCANSSPKKVRRKQAASSPPEPTFPCARQAIWLFLRHQEELTTQ